MSSQTTLSAQYSSADLLAAAIDRQDDFEHTQVEAYFLAEKRNFEPGHELEDWAAAEQQHGRPARPSLGG
jgi:hypothetical protein